MQPGARPALCSRPFLLSYAVPAHHLHFYKVSDLFFTAPNCHSFTATTVSRSGAAIYRHSVSAQTEVKKYEVSIALGCDITGQK